MIQQGNAMKITMCDKKLWREYTGKLSIISVFLSYILIVAKVPDGFWCKTTATIILSIFLVCFFLYTWCSANKKRETEVVINGFKVNIIFGDIFLQDGLKVIPFNEHFDTQVDGIIVTPTSLNGIYLDRYCEIKDRIEDEISKIKPIGQKKRVNGRKDKYKLGTICKVDEYLLMALTNFDNENRANLDRKKYFDCMMNFWNELDVIHGGYPVSIPLLGSGITRFNDGYISKQELLNLILYSLKLSRFQIPADSQLTIVIHNSLFNDINLYKLME